MSDPKLLELGPDEPPADLSDEAIENTISYASAVEEAAEDGAAVGMGFDFSSESLLSMALEIKRRRAERAKDEAAADAVSPSSGWEERLALRKLEDALVEAALVASEALRMVPARHWVVLDDLHAAAEAVFVAREVAEEAGRRPPDVGVDERDEVEFLRSELASVCADRDAQVLAVAALMDDLEKLRAELAARGGE